MSWLASQMAKAEELLQSADKKAGQEIHKVKERAAELGINLTPAVGAPSEESASEQATVVVLSQAAAALLDAEERERILSSGTATIEADEVRPRRPPLLPLPPPPPTVLPNGRRCSRSCKS